MNVSDSRETTIAPPARSWWYVLAIALGIAGLFLRGWQLRRQTLIDDEWHALHKLLAAGYADIASHFGLADYCIPLTLYYRALFDTGMLSEWSMHLPPFLAGLALMAAGYWMLRDVCDAATRTIWLGLVALSPVLVYLSRTARPYTLAALAVLVAIISFTRWWRDRRRRDAIIYIVATVLAGWLHLMTLPFTLAPLLLFGGVSLYGSMSVITRRAALAQLLRLVALGLIISVLLAALLLPAFINDWSSLTRKAGGGSVTLESGWRTWLMLTGSSHAAIGVIALVLAGLGIRPLWQRDRTITGCFLFVLVAGTATIIVVHPAWIQHPGVLARYVEPVLAFVLLFVAQGMASVVAWLPQARLRVVVAMVALGSAFVLGPIPETLYYPNQFMGHPRFQFDYDPGHNPYRGPNGDLVDGPISAFYRSLAKLPPGSVKLIEAPWRLESNYVPHDFLQRAHRQFVKAGMVSGVCGTSNWGDFSEHADRLHFREFVPVSELLAGATWDADYLIIRYQAQISAAAPIPEWPDVSACLPTLEGQFGTPVFRDHEIVVFALRPEARARVESW